LRKREIRGTAQIRIQLDGALVAARRANEIHAADERENQHRGGGQQARVEAGGRDNRDAVLVEAIEIGGQVRGRLVPRLAIGL